MTRSTLGSIEGEGAGVGIASTGTGFGFQMSDGSRLLTKGHASAMSAKPKTHSGPLMRFMNLPRGFSFPDGDDHGSDEKHTTNSAKDSAQFNESSDLNIVG